MSAPPLLVAVIGGGVSGLRRKTLTFPLWQTCARRCLEAGLDVLVVERSAHLGGIWWYDDNPKSLSVYRSLVATTTAAEMAIPGFPFESKSERPTHAAFLGYLQDFAARAKLKASFRFNSSVDKIVRSGAKWTLTVTDTTIRVPMELQVDAVAVCTGHHSEPRVYTDKEVPGIGSFTGRQIHSSQYRTPTIASQQNVLVVGMGTSGMEIAHDVASVAQSVTACSMRMGASNIAAPPKSPRAMVKQLISPRVPVDDGGMGGRTSGGLADLASVRVRIKRIRGADVLFEDGTSLKPDLIVWCTGFVYALPFCTPDLVRVVSATGEDAPGMVGPRIELYQHMWPMQGDTLAFLGMATVMGSMHPLVDLQSRLFAAVLTRKCELPKLGERERWRTAKRAQWATNAESANYRPLQIEAKAYAHEMLGLMGQLDEEWVDTKAAQRSRSGSVPDKSAVVVAAAPATAASRLAAAATMGRSSHRVTAVESTEDEEDEFEEEEEESGSSDVVVVSRAAVDDGPAPRPVAVAVASTPAIASGPASPRTSKRPTLTKSEGRPAALMSATTGTGTGTVTAAADKPAEKTSGHASPSGSGPLPTLGTSSSVLPSLGGGGNSNKVPLAQEPHSSGGAGMARESSQKQLQPLAKRTPTKESDGAHHSTTTTKLMGTIRSLVVGGGARASAAMWDADDLRAHRALWSRHVAPLLVPCPASAACGAQGKRDTMEDTHVLLDRIPGVPEHVASGLWAVFDGHGGAEVARMAEKMLHVRFQKALVQALVLEGKPVEDVDVARMLRKCFKDTDKAINDKLRETDSQNVGCTAAVCVLLGRRLFVANCGDSEVVLSVANASSSSRTASAVELSHKHKPRDEREKARIETLGGMVFGGRVYGTLSVARGFGDTAYKPPVNPQFIVCPDPDVKCVQLGPEHRYVVLACDGLWDKVSHEEAAEFVRGLRECDYSLEECAQWLVQEADDRVSRDNITAVVVDLNWCIDAALHSPKSCPECGAVTFGVQYCTRCGLPWSGTDAAPYDERQAPSVRGRRRVEYKGSKRKKTMQSSNNVMEISGPMNVKHEATGKHAAQKDAAELAALLERTNLELTHKVNQ